MGHKYTKEQLDFLRQAWRHMTRAEVTAAFNNRFGLRQSASAIGTVINRENIRRERRVLLGKRLSFTAEQIAFIRAAYRLMSLSELAAAFHKQFGQIKTAGQIGLFIRNHGIQSGRTGRFEKGQAPWNTGKTGYMGPNVTSFRKGNAPPNRKPLWSERIDSKDGYVLIKVPERDPYTGAPTRYQKKHRWIWEQTHGEKIPRGMVVIFLDGDRRNFEPENLELISRQVEIRLSQMKYHDYPAELKPPVLALAKLVAKTGKLSRKGKDDEK